MPDPLSQSTNNTPTTSQTKFSWNTSTINLLLDTRLEMEKEFNRPSTQKKKLWEKISAKFKDYGYWVSSNELNDKYRNLLATYRSNKERRRRTGEGTIKWEFFKKFDSVIGNKASVMPPDCNLGGTLVSDEESNDTEVKKDEGGMNMRIYLKRELEMDEEDKKQKREWKKVMWEEKKAIKQAEVQVLRDLVNVIQNKSK